MLPLCSLFSSTSPQSLCSHWLVFVRYINSGEIKYEFLFCSAPETTTKAPQAKDIHYMIHRYAPASKTLPASLQEVFESVIKIVNYVKTQAFNIRLYKELCKNMNADHEVLLFYAAGHGLSKRSAINRVFEMKDEIKFFLEIRQRKYLVVHFEDESWNKRVAYLARIFDQQNKLNMMIKGRETHVIFLT